MCTILIGLRCKHEKRNKYSYAHTYIDGRIGVS